MRPDVADKRAMYLNEITYYDWRKEEGENR